MVVAGISEGSKISSRKHIPSFTIMKSFTFVLVAGIVFAFLKEYIEEYCWLVIHFYILP